MEKIAGIVEKGQCDAECAKDVMKYLMMKGPAKVDCGQQAQHCIRLGKCELPEKAVELLGPLDKFGRILQKLTLISTILLPDASGCFVDNHEIGIMEQFFLQKNPQFFAGQSSTEEELELPRKVTEGNVCQLARDLLGCQQCAVCEGNFCNAEPSTAIGHKSAADISRKAMEINPLLLLPNVVGSVLFGVDIDQMAELKEEADVKERK
jgi:hypothetical protein